RSPAPGPGYRWPCPPPPAASGGAWRLPRSPRRAAGPGPRRRTARTPAGPAHRPRPGPPPVPAAAGRPAQPRAPPPPPPPAPPHAPRVRRRRCVSGHTRPDRSERVQAAFAGADPDDLFDRRHPDLPVTDLAGTGRGDDGVDDLLHVDVIGHHLDPDLGQELD